MKEKIVNIIGLGWSGLDAPFENGERWGINCSYVYGELDRVFWLHKPGLIPQSLRLGNDTMNISDVINKFPKMRIYTLDDLSIEKDPLTDKKILFNLEPDKPQGELLKKCEKYPIQEYWQLMRNTYATNTIMYAIGLAILEGFNRIRIYGMEAFSGISDSEYKFERDGIAHICHMAMGRGIKVEIPFQCMITASNNTNNNYGYSG